jgi:hypothetical protein
MVVRVGVPNPKQIVCALAAHDFDDMTPRGHKALGTVGLIGIAKSLCSCTPVVFAIPTKPVAVHFGPEFH